MKVVIFLCIYVLLSFLVAGATGRLLKKRRLELEEYQKVIRQTAAGRMGKKD